MRTSLFRPLACAALLVAGPVNAQRRVADAPPPPSARRVGYVSGVTVNGGMVSPDGRWVVVSGWDTKEDGIWILPVSGGEPRRVLYGYGEVRPSFTPAGDQIVFTSSRVNRSPNGTNQYVVTAPFDGERGVLSGDVKQIGLQPSSAFAPILSPDGRWVAYVTTSRELRVVPVRGGTERVLGRMEPFGMAARTLSWTADSRALEWNFSEAGRPSPRRYRVGIDGGPPAVIAEATPIRGPLLPDGKHSLHLRNPGSDGVLAINDLNGTPVAEIPWPDLVPLRASPNGRHLLAIDRDQEATLRAVSTGGGTSRVVVPADGQYLWPEGWTAAGELIYGDSDGWRRVSLRGGPSRVLSLDQFGARAAWHAFAGNRGLVLANDSSSHAIHLVDFESGGARLLANGAVAQDVRGAGGRYGVDRGRFLFIARDNDALHIRAANADGTIEHVRTVPYGLLDGIGRGVYGRRFAYLEQQRDTVWLMTTDGPDATPRRVVRVPNTNARGELAWSNDGNRIAIAGSKADQLHIVNLGAPGQSATLRTIATSLDYFYEIFWHPGDAAITVVAEPKDGSGANIARIDIADGRTTILTADDPNPVWGHVVSPDGSTIVYPSEVHKGTSIWVYDIERILRENRRP